MSCRSHQPASHKRGRHYSSRHGARGGATTIETAITIMIFVTLVFGMLDLGLAVFRRQLLAEAARQVARQAIVRGSMSSVLGSWGPTTHAGTADADDDFGNAVESLLTGMDPADVSVQVEWPEGNDLDDPVRVTLSTTYTPLLTFVLGSDPYTLSAFSEMGIAH